MAYSARRDGFRDTATISCGMHTISPYPTVDRISFEGQRSREYSRRMVEIRNVRLTDIFLFFFLLPSETTKTRRGEERREKRLRFACPSSFCSETKRAWRKRYGIGEATLCSRWSWRRLRFAGGWRRRKLKARAWRGGGQAVKKSCPNKGALFHAQCICSRLRHDR